MVTGGWITQMTQTRSAHAPAAWLHARCVRGGVTVSLAATVFGSDEESR